MQPRKAELMYLNRNIEAVQVILGSSVHNTMVGLMDADSRYRYVTMQEWMRLSEAFNKVEDALIAFNHLVHDMNGTSAEPEPHGSRDTFVPREACVSSDGPDGERFNPLQD